MKQTKRFICVAIIIAVLSSMYCVALIRSISDVLLTDIAGVKLEVIRVIPDEQKIVLLLHHEESSSLIGYYPYDYEIEYRVLNMWRSAPWVRDWREAPAILYHGIDEEKSPVEITLTYGEQYGVLKPGRTYRIFFTAFCKGEYAEPISYKVGAEFVI